MRTFVLLFVLLTLPACGREPEVVADPEPVAGKPVETPSPAKPRVVFLGDSLTAGLGLPSDQSYPSLIGKKLKDSGYDYEIVNAGVSGDTSAGGLRRLDWSLEGNVRALVLALGANDGLRGLPPAIRKAEVDGAAQAAAPYRSSSAAKAPASSGAAAVSASRGRSCR